MSKSFVKPSNLALPTAALVINISPVQYDQDQNDDEDILLLRSKNDSKYNKVNGGSSFKSNFLMSAFSLIAVRLVNELSETPDGALLSR
jgi:hypothetical protein